MTDLVWQRWILDYVALDMLFTRSRRQDRPIMIETNPSWHEISRLVMTRRPFVLMEIGWLANAGTLAICIIGEHSVPLLQIYLSRMQLDQVEETAKKAEKEGEGERMIDNRRQNLPFNVVPRKTKVSSRKRFQHSGIKLGRHLNMKGLKQYKVKVGRGNWLKTVVEQALLDVEQSNERPWETMLPTRVSNTRRKQDEIFCSKL